MDSMDLQDCRFRSVSGLILYLGLLIFRFFCKAAVINISIFTMDQMTMCYGKGIPRCDGHRELLPDSAELYSVFQHTVKDQQLYCCAYFCVFV